MNITTRSTLPGSIPPEVEARLRDQLADFRGKITGGRKPNFFSRPVVRVAIGGITAAGFIIAGFLLIPGWKGGQGLYAAALKEFAAKQSLSYTIVLSPGVEIEVVTKVPGLERKKTSWGIEMISDIREDKCLVLFHKEKSYLWKQAKYSINGIGNLDSFENLPAKADEKLGTRMIEGRMAEGFRAVRISSDKNKASLIDIWIDSVTHSLVYINTGYKLDGIVRHLLEIKNIKINEPIDDSMFSLIPPADYIQEDEPINPFFLMPPSK